MPEARVPLGHAFNVVHDGKYRLTVSSRNIVNTFDYLGQLIGLPRLPGERNADYRRRLWDVYPNRGGTHEKGLTNAITRELGLAQYNALVISTSGATNPRVVVDDTKVYLYNEWKHEEDYTLEMEVDIYDRDGDAYYLADLVSYINGASSYFTLALVSGVDSHTPSTVLVRSDSLVYVEWETVYPHYRNLLEHGDIVASTEKFSSQSDDVFITRKATEALVVAPGDYYIDYDTGLIYSYSPAGVGTTVRYGYRDFPFTIKASPVMLFEFGSDTYREEIFNQVPQPDGTTTDGLPKSEAVDYINELLAAKGMLWGE